MAPFEIESLQMGGSSGLSFIVGQKVPLGHLLPLVRRCFHERLDQAVGVRSDVLKTKADDPVPAPQALLQVLGSTIGQKFASTQKSS